MNLEDNDDITVSVILPGASYRFPPPDKFSAQLDGFSSLTWLKAVRRCLMITNIAATLQTVIAISFLDSEAALWIDGSGMNETTPFNTFEAQFKDAFVPDDFFNQVGARLSALYSSPTAAHYVAEARRLLTVLLSDTENESARSEIEAFAFISFIHGCPKAMNELLRALQIAKPLNVYELFRAAGQYDQVFYATWK